MALKLVSFVAMGLVAVAHADEIETTEAIAEPKAEAQVIGEVEQEVQTMSSEGWAMFDALYETKDNDKEEAVEENTEALVAAASTGKCYGNWRSGFSERIKSCAMSNGGAAAGTANCIRMRYGVSAGCADCMGQMAACGMGCINECCTGSCTTSGPCKACNKRKCAPGFARCAGSWPPQ